MKTTRPKAVFKQYEQGQMMAIPPTLDELIDKGHLVRVISRCIDELDLSNVFNRYRGGGTSSYHPRMMLKVIVYAYAVKIYSGRKIARALRQDITFMWVSGMNQPDFRTINLFRSGVLAKTIKDVFSSVLVFLMEEGYVSFENYFVDGTDVHAEANKHKVVWKKNAERYKNAALEKMKELFTKIDQINEQENRVYGDHDLEETGAQSHITEDQIKQQADKLTRIIETHAGETKARQAKSIKKKLEQQQEKIIKYEQQQEICKGRSGYSITDPQASVLRTKTDELRPAYNAMIGTENQMIVNYSLHQNPSDTANFIDHLKGLSVHTDRKPKNMMGDSAFGSEENYQALAEREIGNYLKYNTFHYEKTAAHKKQLFHKDNLSYHPEGDYFVCPNDRHIRFVRQATKKTKSGYEQHLKIYECESCEACPFAKECKKTQQNRSVTVSETFEQFKQQARDNLNSETGIKLRKQRGVEVESVFGDIKRNMLFTRFHVRGIDKANAEFGIVSIAHNFKKIYLKQGIIAECLRTQRE